MDDTVSLAANPVADLVTMIVGHLEDQNGETRAEDAIALAAHLTGVSTLQLAGVNPLKLQRAPGTWLEDKNIDDLLTANSTDYQTMFDEGALFGVLYDCLVHEDSFATPEHFPSILSIKATKGGALLPAAHRPEIDLAHNAALLQNKLAAIVKEHSLPPAEVPLYGIYAMATIINLASDVISPPAAILLALSTLWHAAHSVPAKVAP